MILQLQLKTCERLSWKCLIHNMQDKKKPILLIIPIIFISLLVAIDQLTKYIIVSNFKLGESKEIIPGIFDLNYVRNEGAAWGMLSGKRIFFLILTFIIIGACFYIYMNIYNNKHFFLLKIDLIVLVAGAIGNMIDRIKLGYVVDFFYFKPIDFPVFNVADIFVVVSMIFLIILIIFKYTEEDFDIMLGVKKIDE